MKTATAKQNPLLDVEEARLLAKDIMSFPVVAIPAEASVREAARRMAERRVSGLAVLDRRRRGIGIVSASDIVAFEATSHDKVVTDREKAEMEGEAHRRIRGGFQLVHADDTRVRDVMTPAIVTACETATVAHLARLMSQRTIHRVCIERDGALVGIVTSLDIVKAVGRGGGPASSLR